MVQNDLHFLIQYSFEIVLHHTFFISSKCIDENDNKSHHTFLSLSLSIYLSISLLFLYIFFLIASNHLDGAQQ